ncbi:MAG TPA: hypothetical protein VM580_21355 [Labilithrix sp.]|nr:hypothetical protein [Labilithrix sp.]
MNLVSMKSLVASLLVASVAVAGCAAEPAQNDNEDGVVETSQAELSWLSSLYVGNYEWRAAGSGSFLDFKSLNLKGNGRYSADVAAHLVNPNVVCIAFPCTQPEQGRWSVQLTFLGLRIQVQPDGFKPSRSYYASAPNKKSLELFRSGQKTKLFVKSDIIEVPITCANVLCAVGTICEMQNGKPACIPQASCANILCGPNTVCQVVDGLAQCVPQVTCASVLCAPGTICEMQNDEPVCVPQSKPECKRTGCSGHVCADHDVVTTCIYKPEYACYQEATCERQADGQCGFTQTDELTSCLAGN